MASGGTDPDQKMRRQWVAHYRCCLAKGGAACRWKRRDKGRKPKVTK